MNLCFLTVPHVIPSGKYCEETKENSEKQKVVLNVKKGKLILQIKPLKHKVDVS